MKIWQTALIPLLVFGGVNQPVEAQNQARAIVGPVPGLLVERTSAGDYRITYPTESGNVGTFVFVPATGSEPSIDAVVRQLGNGRLVYEYTFENQPTARQDLYSVTLPIPFYGQPTFAAPPGWEAMTAESKQRMVFYKVPHPGASQRDGLPPAGRLAGFRVESVLLPVPAEVACQGAAPLPNFPQDMPTRVFQRLDQVLITRDHSVAWTIVPGLLPFGEKEPELTAAVATARIRNAHSRALETSRHPLRAEILAALAEAIELLGPQRSQGAAAITRARSLLSERVSDRWSAGLAASLEICLEHLAQKYGL